MTQFAVFVATMAVSSIGAGVSMRRRGESFRLWAALGLGLGPFVLPYARQYLADRGAASATLGRSSRRSLRSWAARRTTAGSPGAGTVAPLGGYHSGGQRLATVPVRSSALSRVPVVPRRRRGCPR